MGIIIFLIVKEFTIEGINITSISKKFEQKFKFDLIIIVLNIILHL